MILGFCTYDQEVVELTGVLNTSGTTTDDNHVHKSVNFILRLVLEGSGFNAYINLAQYPSEGKEKYLTVHELGPNLVGIREFLEEASILGNTLDTKGLVLTANGVHEVVVRNGDSAGLTLDIRNVYNACQFLTIGSR